MCVGGDNGRHGFATEAGDLSELANRRAGAMRNLNHVIAHLRFLGGPAGTQAHHDESGADFTRFAASVLVHLGSRRRHLSFRVVHGSSRRARASLSRIAINSGTRGDTSALASASLRCAKVIPRSSGASTRSSTTLRIWLDRSPWSLSNQERALAPGAVPTEVNIQ